jgi:hypothetical protein
MIKIRTGNVSLSNIYFWLYRLHIVTTFFSGGNAMIRESNQKVQRVRERLEKLIDELDDVVTEAQKIINAGPARNSNAADSHWILQIDQQREVLTAVVSVLAEANVESRHLAGK